MKWNVADAKQKLSEVIRKASESPQWIFSRDRPVAVLVSPETFEELSELKGRQRDAIAEAFAELRKICDEEDYVLEAPLRRDRSNSFAEALDGAD